MKTVVLAGALTTALAATASARIVNGAIGRAINGGDLACFGLFFDGVANNCATDKAFDVPLDLDNFGNKSVSFSFTNAQSQGVSCTLNATDAAGSLASFQQTAVVNTTTVGNGSLSTAPLTVVGNGRLWLSCTIKPNSKLMTIAYAP